MPRLPLALCAILGAAVSLDAQPKDEEVLDKIYATALTASPAYGHLRELTTRFPGRLGGSRNLAGAVQWAKATLDGMKLDRVELQPVLVPHWERGAPEAVYLLTPTGMAAPLTAVALGGSASTPAGGVMAGVVEVQTLAELAALGREKIAGRIVFFNRPMNPAYLSTGRAYGEAGDQRNRGPAEAVKFGAVAALVRSLTLALDDVPHTGSTTFPAGTDKIPAAALSPLAANQLSAALAADPRARVGLKIHAQWFPDAPSHNVIGELRGTEFPDEIILVGGHLDSWDISPGAHDDGAGVVQSIEVLRLFQKLGLQPRHTLRCVLFTNEENGTRGGATYATVARKKTERHRFAVETDNGGFQPRGFSLGNAAGNAHELAARWQPLFAPYGIFTFTKGSGGTDVHPLLAQGAIVAGLTPDSQRYFDYHHAATDTLAQVNPRELELGAAALASLIYVVDQHGL